MEIFVTYIYQPFFNILVGIYWLLGQIMANPDMGISVAIFAIVVRLVLLPLDFIGERSASEKAAIIDKLDHLKKEFAHDQVRLRQEQRKIFRSNPGAVIGETATIIVQLIIILMLYRIFSTGLEGEDLHLLYDFMPSIPLPINLTFLGKFDLSHPNATLNLIQSLLIFVVEAFHMLFSVRPTSRKEFLSLGIALPVVSYIIFALLPAGKKVFIITSLLISILITVFKQLAFWYDMYLVPSSQKEAAHQ